MNTFALRMFDDLDADRISLTKIEFRSPQGRHRSRSRRTFSMEIPKTNFLVSTIMRRRKEQILEQHGKFLTKRRSGHPRNQKISPIIKKVATANFLSRTTKGFTSGGGQRISNNNYIF